MSWIHHFSPLLCNILCLLAVSNPSQYFLYQWGNRNNSIYSRNKGFNIEWAHVIVERAEGWGKMPEKRKLNSLKSKPRTSACNTRPGGLPKLSWMLLQPSECLGKQPGSLSLQPWSKSFSELLWEAAVMFTFICLPSPLENKISTIQTTQIWHSLAKSDQNQTWEVILRRRVASFRMTWWWYWVDNGQLNPSCATRQPSNL